jgi:hypothetical protein
LCLLFMSARHPTSTSKPSTTNTTTSAYKSRYSSSSIAVDAVEQMEGVVLDSTGLRPWWLLEAAEPEVRLEEMHLLRLRCRCSSGGLTVWEYRVHELTGGDHPKGSSERNTSYRHKVSITIEATIRMGGSSGTKWSG